MADLIKRLREGLLSMGTSEDGEIDLYDIDDAYQVMDEAADALAEARRDLANECERRDDIIASETHLRKEAEAELAEARAQIAAKDAALNTSMLSYTAMIRDLGAQIAAKDAALRKIRHWLYEEEEAHAGEIAMIDAALEKTNG